MDRTNFAQLSQRIDDLYAGGKGEQGLALLQQAREKSWENSAWQAFFRGEYEFFVNKDYTAQERCYLQALEVAPGEVVFLRNMGLCLSWQGREEEAISWFDKALAVRADDYDALRGRAVSLSNLGREEEALVWFDKALAVKGDDYNALCRRGVALSKLGSEEEALVWFDKALAVKEDDYNALRGRGVALSKLGREEEALVWFDKALAVKEDDYDALRQRGVALSNLGREEEALVWYDKALAVKGDDSEALYGRGVVLSKLGCDEEALVWFDKALAVRRDEYDALRQRGVSLSCLGREEEALVWYDKALTVKGDDYAALRGRGVALSKLGREEEAIIWFDKALAVKEDDYNTLRQRGVSLSCLSREEEALVWFDKALAVQEDDALSWLGRGTSLLNLDRYGEAAQDFEKVLQLEQGNVQARRYLSLARRLGGKGKEGEADFVPSVPDSSPEQKGSPQPNPPRQQAQMDFFDALHKVWGMTGSMEDYLTKSKEAQALLDGFIMGSGGLDSSRTLLFGLRKWNSYTPSLPPDITLSGTGNGERSIGGGYFLWHKGEGVVIDPGFNFIENFHAMGGMLADIGHIVITHAHNDHTSDLESLLSLFYRRRRECEDKGLIKDFKAPDLYLNTGAFQKFAPMLNLRSSPHIGKVRVLAEQEEYHLGKNGLHLRVLPAYHDEVITKSYSVGLLFTFPAEGNEDSGENKKKRRTGGKGGAATAKTLLFTGDTGFVPERGKEEGASGELREISSRYQIARPDFLVPHMGSLHPDEFANISNKEECYAKIRTRELFYPNHLGFMGTVMLVNALRPRHVFLSEFGEELREFLPDLMKLMRDCTNQLMGEARPQAFLPMDLLFCCDLQAERLYSISQECFAPLCRCDVDYCATEHLFHYYDPQKDEVRPLGENLPRFRGSVGRKEGLYFGPK